MKRNYGIDLLRVVCMFGVVVLHLLGQGGVLKHTVPFSGNYYFTQFLQVACFCAVNCYALISGFVGWNRQPKLRTLATVWARGLFWCLFWTVAISLWKPGAVGKDQWLNAVLPVSRGQYWYLTAYVGLFFFQPILNAAVKHLSRRELEWTLLGLLAFAVYPLSQITNLLRLSVGYSYSWLLILYLLGGYLEKYEIAKGFTAKRWLLWWLGITLAAWLPRMAAFRLLPGLAGEVHGTLYLQYTSPTVILAAVALVLGFSRLELKPGLIPPVRRLTPHCFGVYLFHVQPLVFNHVLPDCLAPMATAPLWQMALALFAAAGLIYALGTAADWVLTAILRGRK